MILLLAIVIFFVLAVIVGLIIDSALYQKKKVEPVFETIGRVRWLNLRTGKLEEWDGIPVYRAPLPPNQLQFHSDSTGKYVDAVFIPEDVEIEEFFFGVSCDE